MLAHLAGGVYLAILAVLAVYGGHRSFLVWKCWQLRKRLDELKAGLPPVPVAAFDEPEKLPYVTVQLAIYNEATVAPRLLEYVSRLEWPRSRLEIQVLDDSTDETYALMEPQIRQMRDAGLDVTYIHRTDRVGYKAGALDNGLRSAKGDLLAFFDADFMPNPDFLRTLIPHFLDPVEGPRVAMVQGRWGHENRDHSTLTRVAALMLDGHHLIENRIRAAADWLFNFAGTGGIWRKEAIVSSGGWQHDTLTEDLDLSYRAQLLGWKFVYRETAVVPAELPEDMASFRAQQFRWAKGTVQTRRKLLGRIVKSDLSFGAKVEAFFHLTPHFAYPLTMALTILLLPVVLLLPAKTPWTMLFLDLPLFLGTTGSLTAFYGLAERAQGRRAIEAVKVTPALIAVGVGLTPLITKALFEGSSAMAGEFVRTPKKGSKAGRYKANQFDMPVWEPLLFAVAMSDMIASLATGHYFATPFAALFACGYGAMSFAMVADQLERRRAAVVEPEPVSDAAPLATDSFEAAAE
jgi:cellulose synthase/poly-beta-1,6-N-acetylglucosamine synthase-like glycosyltransferase